MRPKKYVVGKSGAKLRNICSEFCLHDGFLAKKWRQWSGCIDFNDSFSIMVYDGQFVVSFALVELIGWGLELILSRWFRPLKFLLLLTNEDNRTLRNYLSHRKHGSSFFLQKFRFVLCFLKSSLTSFEWSLDYIALAKVGQAWILQLRPRKFASLFSSNFDMLQRWSACVRVRACVWEYVHGCMCEWGREREREQGVKVCERDGCSNPLFSWTRVRWNLKLDHETTKQLRRKKERNGGHECRPKIQFVECVSWHFFNRICNK